MLITGFLAYLPGGDETASTASAASVRRFAADRGHRLLEAECPIAVWPSSESTRVTPYLFRTEPGTLGSSIANEVDRPRSDRAAWEAWARKRLRRYTMLELGADAVRITDDLLGRMRHYRADVPGGMVVSSSIHALLTCFPDLSRPADPLALAEVLTGGSPSQDRTVHMKIRVSVAGEETVWSRGRGPRREAASRLEVPEIDAGATESEWIERLCSHLTRSLAGCVADPARVVLPLTGGFDSRWLACTARAAGLRPHAITLGHPRHLEVRAARAVGRVLDLPHRVFPPHPDPMNLIPVWRETTEGQVGTGTVFLSGLLDRGFPPGSTVLSGYYGDVLAAGALHWASGQDASTRESCAEIITRRLVQGVRPEFARILGLACSDTDLFDAVLPALPRTPVPHQTLLMWNLEQPRGMVHQLAYLGREYHVGIPFYDLDLIRAWLAVPRDRLEDKRLLRAVFRERHPAVATLPHADRKPTSLPGGWEPFRYDVHWLLQWIGDELQRRLLPPGMRRANPTNIWHTWHGMSREHRRRQIETVAAHGDAVGEVLGYELPIGAGPPPWERIALSPGRENRVIRSFYLLTEYCRWLRDTLPGS